MSADDVIRLASMVRYYRAQLYAISRIKTNDARVLSEIAAKAIKEYPEHHPWCAMSDLYQASDCPQCPELWQRYPNTPMLSTAG